ncbi:MAG: alpha/beta hydrolase [Bradyrhizobiaceae bacterium]|nr:alpha/beta hydrolase [Bradyrhizobiaceae bacterium]
MPILKVGPYDLDYVEAGQGPAVVLVHSSAAGYRQWQKLMEELAGRYRLIAVNLFGYGATSKWPGDRPMTLGDQASLVAAAADLDAGDVALVGHSLGAAVACEAALQLGARVRVLAAFEPILFYLLRDHREIAAYADIEGMSRNYLEFARRGDWNEVGHHFIDYWAGDGTWAATPEERKARVLPVLPPIAHEWEMLGFKGRPIAELGKIAAPVHLLRAADTNLSTKTVAALLQHAHPHWMVHELPTGGHLAPIMRPDLVNPVFAEILDETRPG